MSSVDAITGNNGFPLADGNANCHHKELLREYVKAARGILVDWAGERLSLFYDADVEKMYLQECKDLIEEIAEVEI